MDEFNAMFNGIIKDTSVIQRLCQSYQKETNLKQLLQNAILHKKYCNPDNSQVIELISYIPLDLKCDLQKAKWLYDWCLDNLDYGRLKKPYFPLVRTDLDVLELKEGTCGDFSHLFISFMDALNIKAKYVKVVRDIHNDEQDHICACFYNEEEQRWILVDPTPSYGRISGWDIKHREIKFIDKDAHWESLKKEEVLWAMRSVEKYNSLLLSGMIYAPWIYEGIINQTKTETESIFVLLTLDSSLKWNMQVTWHMNAADTRKCPIRLRRTSNSDSYEWDECIDEDLEVWDEKRWNSNGSVTEGTKRENLLVGIAFNHIEKINIRLFNLIGVIESECKMNSYQ